MEWWFGSKPGTVNVPTVDQSQYVPETYNPDYAQYDQYNQMLMSQLAAQQNQALQAQQAQLGNNLLNRGVQSSGFSGLQQAQLQQGNAQALMNALEQQKAQQFTTEQNKAWQNRSAQEQARQNLANMLFQGQLRANEVNAANQASEGFLPGLVQAVGTVGGAIAGGPAGATIANALFSSKKKTQPSPYQLNMSSFPTGNLGGY